MQKRSVKSSSGRDVRRNISIALEVKLLVSWGEKQQFVTCATQNAAVCSTLMSFVLRVKLQNRFCANVEELEVYCSKYVS